MASQDQFQRFIFEHSQVRGAWVQLGDSFREIINQAPYPDSVRQLLGESLVASVLMSSTLKFEGTLSLQAAGEGALRTLMAECSHDRKIRGLARFDEQAMSGETLHELLGQSRMAITITPEKGQRYQGVVPREADNLAGCLEEYFERSEQIATSLFLFADGDTAAGLLLQRLPGHTEEDDDLWNRVNHLARTVEAEELLKLDSETLLHRLFHEETVRLYEPEPVEFRCSCSRERTLAALESIGKEECYSILDEQGSIDMDCQFCHANYRFNRNDIDHLFTGHTLH
ncbi:MULTISPECIES: Hsp33 family molecular chaperone HslO [Marinobacter]|jgi:molecular chaperone Hsp33|uniref:33 kDa chaperonin n=1 Tax=Marinobacter vinifirmus TaxID=355591 RepID=A0A259W0X7_9GAMM|nr:MULTISPECIES: Hsp33 family molecular chaperone HslO [Marinobacter]HBM49218.1 Hsp33 family molecular chaperone HslO [Marinobacter sp.]ERP87908.1 Hsp33 chaperonin [Marinobacter sp. ES-1]KRW81203.1 molecular chaperone Hsp33 [Marinobacter sp. P4B1]MCE0759180.1 Hsp33 family molecular chaperone HslO [Marinobacter sp. G11]OZC36257.1 Hsp33 family molecular chaperone [Marinobacter vinifirmus]|tara:strand:- start:106 stop:960 length:855 start_codon:yes stop_codon:yes gene_type:complete